MEMAHEREGYRRGQVQISMHPGQFLKHSEAHVYITRAWCTAGRCNPCGLITRNWRLGEEFIQACDKGESQAREPIPLFRTMASSTPSPTSKTPGTRRAVHPCHFQSNLCGPVVVRGGPCSVGSQKMPAELVTRFWKAAAARGPDADRASSPRPCLIRPLFTIPARVPFTEANR